MTISAPKTDTARIEELLDRIVGGNVSLADFQRDFEWGPSAVRSLIATILMGWPAGSLLLLDGKHKELATRSFVGGPDLSSDQASEIIVLDGQQRLTSLLHALHPVGRTSYAIPLGAFFKGSVDDIEEGLTVVKDGNDGLSRVGSPVDDLLIPLTVLRSKRAFFAWRDALIPEALTEELNFRLSQAYRDHLHWLHDYSFPVVTLDRTIDSAAVARIFERVNRTGLRLGSFDLVVARTFTDRWNLRDRWADARSEYPLLNSFLKDDGLPVLQAIALREEKNVRQAAVLDLDPNVVSDRWEDSLKAVNESLGFLAHECGVVRPDWLPYRAFLLVLGALAMDEPLIFSREVLRRYVLSRSFALRFDVAANTRVVEDYRMLLEVLRGTQEMPELEPVENAVLAQATKQRRGTLWRAFMCVLSINEAQDPLDRPMRLDTLPLGKHFDLDVPEARPVPLVQRGAQGWHLRALTTVLVNPTTATDIRRAIQSADSTFNLDFSQPGLRSQLIDDPDQLPQYSRSPQELVGARLASLETWLRANGVFSSASSDGDSSA